MRIAIQNACPGMTLTDDIVLPEGNGMVEKSLPLTSDIIIKLTLAGVTELSIIDPEKDSAEISPPAAVPEPEKTAIEPGLRVSGFSLLMTPCRQGLRLNPQERYRKTSRWKLFAKWWWNSSKNRCEFDGVATGTEPKPGKEGPCHFTVPHIANAGELEIVRKSRGYWEAKKHIGNLHRVKKDSVVAEKRYAVPPQPGITVRGESVGGEEPGDEIIILEAGAALSKDDEREIVAEIDGVLYDINNRIGIVPLDFNGSFELQTDKMTARLVIHPPGEDGTMPAERVLRELIKNNQIVFGVKESLIKEIFPRIAEGDIPADPVIIAEGNAPEHGLNGKIEFLFNTETSLAPKENPDGSVDYKDVDIIVAVPKGKELVRLHPPIQGKPGKTIFGDKLPCREGAPASLPVGPNTEPVPEKGVLVATIDGIVRHTGAGVEVCEGYVIKGDVDFSTGNIKYDKSVIINGDVKAGFSVDCGGDLQVSGIIEDCIVNVGGNVLCKHGFIGHGKGVIEAKGDVNIGFALNQTIKSQKNVNIAREAINCTIFARQAITIHGNPLSVAGGTLVARDSIIVYTVGNHSGVQTHLEVGLDFALHEELKKTEEIIAGIHGNHRKLADSVAKVQHTIIMGKKLAPQAQEIYDKIKIAIAKLEEQIGLHETRKKHIEQKMHELDNAFIKIEHASMPGTLFNIGDLHRFCKEEVIGPKTVRRIKGEINIA